MDNTERKLVRQNFLWMPLLWIFFSDIIYSVFAFSIGAIIWSERINLGRKSPFVHFFCEASLMGGIGILYIILLNSVALIIGILFALIKRKALPFSLKKKVVYFLFCFYLTIGFAFYYF